MSYFPIIIEYSTVFQVLNFNIQNMFTLELQNKSPKLQVYATSQKPELGNKSLGWKKLTFHVKKLYFLYLMSKS